ncbi:strictosidine synthase 1-like [Hibiscus syriacus]|uniref:Strictosidine synthase 1-like n=1 Tax=Hibiscus syriacus TaxID=106335 RepID=A0A6A2YXG9_HIBSY|nr:protein STRICTOSIDINE SYNTHASE-LIKE 12-like [Hibiscus syriacus]KAE8684030.1 strictosidine synthase 1-like [Hibiscus syriacus]
MAYTISLTKVMITLMFPIFIFLIHVPSMVLSQSFRSLQLPPKAVGPESIAFESGPVTGRFYVGIADGRILQFNGPRVGFLNFGFTSPNRSKQLCDGTTDPNMGPICGRPLGLAFHYPSNKLYACDAYFGLVVLGSAGKQATRVSDTADGQSYRFCNGLDVHQLTGNVLFTDTSSVNDLRNASRALNTNDITGRLLMYDPDTDRVRVLMKNLSGPAGVAVSQDGTYVLVSNFIGNNTIRYWLRGPRANTYDSIDFQERPDNIRRTVVGDFWRAAAMVKQPAQSLIPIAQRMDVIGRVSRTVNLEAWYGNTLISEVQEFGGELYVGSRFTSFVGVYRF